MKKLFILISFFVFFFTFNSSKVNALVNLVPTHVDIESSSTGNFTLFNSYYPFIGTRDTLVKITTVFDSNTIDSVYGIFPYKCSYNCNSITNSIHYKITKLNNTDCTYPYYLTHSCFTGEGIPGGSEGTRSLILVVKDLNGEKLVFSSSASELDSLFNSIDADPSYYQDLNINRNTDQKITQQIPIEYNILKRSEFRTNKLTAMDLSYYVDLTPPEYVKTIVTPSSSDGVETVPSLNTSSNLITYKQKVNITISSEKNQSGVLNNAFTSSLNNTEAIKLIGNNLNCKRINSDKIIEGVIVKSGEICDFVYQIYISRVVTQALLSQPGYTEKTFFNYTSTDSAGNQGIYLEKLSNSVTVEHTISDTLNLDIGVLEDNQVFRFWSSKNHGHFYTTSGLEKDLILKKYSTFEWQFEGVAYKSTDCSDSSSSKVYRFWSAQNQHHFYTNSATERDLVINKYTDSEWLYEGEAFCAFGFGGENRIPVYRFWSEQNHVHFYTASEQEKNDTIAKYSDKEWHFEGIAYFVNK